MKEHIDEIIALLEIGAENTQEHLNCMEEYDFDKFGRGEVYEAEAKRMNDMVDILKKESKQWKSHA